MDCYSKDLQLTNHDRGGLRLNGFAEVTATGKCAQAILDSKDKEPLKLQLSGVLIPSLPVTKRLDKRSGLSAQETKNSDCGESTVGTKYVLTFLLKRDTADTDNRRAWATFIDKVGNRHEIGSLSVSLGDAPAVEVSNAAKVEFRVSLGERGPYMLVTAAVLFIVAWSCLVKFGGLYDQSSPKRVAGQEGEEPPPEQAPTFSLARVQMAFWGLVVALSFLGIYSSTGTMEVINPQVLVLLGISAATGLGSVLVGDTKPLVAAKVGFIPPASEGKSHFLPDILSDGAGNISVHRFQSALWTLVLGLVFIWTVISTLTMPEFSVTLLTLMGISNGTYLGFKYSDKQ